MAPPRTADLAAASAKLADRDRKARHGRLYSVKVRTRDRKTATVSWEVDTHRYEALPYVLRDISVQLRIDGPDRALEVLQTWTHDQLCEHLGQFTQAELRPPAMRPRG